MFNRGEELRNIAAIVNSPLRHRSSSYSNSTCLYGFPVCLAAPVVELNSRFHIKDV